PHLEQMRSKTGRPHWLVLDEAHHLLPALSDSASATLNQDLSGFLFITVHPEHVSRTVLSGVALIVVIGKSPAKTIQRACQSLDEPPPPVSDRELKAGEGLVWRRGTGESPIWFRSEPPRTEMRRHQRKYTEGQLEPDKCFYFRGPDGKLNLKAHNLSLFLQIADGLDDETWLYHLKRGDYSQWLRNSLQDESLASEVEKIEKEGETEPRRSREQIRARIEERYTLPA
ncbi:MAG TPA: phosphoglycolate phosphatase, partial [Acidobacteriota bacterium]|nr:phosphoglycolate phosphatase [Acidobacteriota bacterium]